MSIRYIARGTPEYNRDYQKGWAASMRLSDGALDRADQRGVSHAWYDGYMDNAAGREKWHLRSTCPAINGGVCWAGHSQSDFITS